MQRLALVVLAGEEGADLEVLDRLVDLAELGLGLGQRRRVVLLLGELDHDLDVVEALVELGEAVELALEGREPAGDAGRVLLVVPEVGRRDLLAEVGDLGTHAVEVEHLADGLHRRPELLDLHVEIGTGHEEQGYVTPRGRTLIAGRPPTARRLHCSQ